MAGVLYKKEREVLEYLAQFQRQYGYSPTLSENLIELPEETLALLETAMEELGLTKNTRIRIDELPETNYIKIREILLF